MHGLGLARRRSEGLKKTRVAACPQPRNALEKFEDQTSQGLGQFSKFELLKIDRTPASSAEPRMSQQPERNAQFAKRGSGKRPEQTLIFED